jgi:hypothetical protein
MTHILLSEDAENSFMLLKGRALKSYKTSICTQKQDGVIHNGSTISFSIAIAASTFKMIGTRKLTVCV